jgi:CheY-like chemotaxis protein
MNSPGGSRSSNAIPTGTRVLCVDDESMIGELIAQILRSQNGCRVITARTGVEALEVLQQNGFDVVLIDYLMPGIDGGELFRRIEHAFPEVVSKLIFITGDTLTANTLEFIASTGRPLLTKPFGLPELMSALGNLLAQHAPAPPDR